MSQPTAGSMLNDLLRAQEEGVPVEDVEELKQKLRKQITRQLHNSTNEATISIEKLFIRAGHKPENKTCNHAHYEFDKHGRYCTCGTIMVDFGD